LTPASRRVAGILGALVVLGLAVYHDANKTLDALDPLNPTADDRDGFQDFRDTVYVPSHALLDGENPYDHELALTRHPFRQEFGLYTPAWFAVAVPVAVLPYRAGQITWFAGAMVVAAVAAAFLLPRIAGRRLSPAAILLVAAGLLVSAPGQLGVFSGQPHLMLLVGLALVAVALVAPPTGRREFMLTAGLVVLLLKPQTGLPAAVLVGAGLRYWRPVVRAIAVVAVASLVPLVAATVAAGGLGDFADSVVDNADYSTTFYGDFSRPNLDRLDALNLVGQATDGQIGAGAQTVQLVAGLALGVVALQYGRRRGAPPEVAVVVLATGMLVSTPHFGYDGVFAAAGLAALLARWPWPRENRGVYAAVGAGLALPLAHLASFDEALGDLGVPLDLLQSVDSAAVLVAFAGSCWLLWRGQAAEPGPLSPAGRGMSVQS
jgi:hypothetical protein